jgi:cytoskeletal protein RodZ
MPGSFIDFGHFLKQQRELRGLSRDVAALEDGQNDRFPELVFVVNHLKAYAQVLGLSPDDVLNRFHEIPGTLAPTEQSPVALEAARRKSAWKVLVLLAVLLLAAGAALWWWTETARVQPRGQVPAGTTGVELSAAAAL